MKETRFTHTPEEEKNFAEPINIHEDGSITGGKIGCGIYKLGENYESGGAGLCSNTEDYIKLVEALANGGVGATGNRILKEESIELLREDRMHDGITEHMWFHNMYQIINSIVERNRFSSPITNTEKKILQTAIRLFLENGYSGTTLKMISAECGLRQGTIHG